MKYSIIFEKCIESGYIAYVPDLPVCFSTGNTLLEVKANIKEAIELYLEDSKDEGSAGRFSNLPEGSQTRN